YLPPELRNNPDLQARAIIVKRLQMLPVEFVVRGYLMGNAWKEYKKHGTVGGVKMPAGLREGDPLPQPLFTPTTKSETGHDVSITFDQMVEILKAWLVQIGSTRDALELAKEARQMALDLYQRGQEHAKSRRVRILDTKFELGLDTDGRLTLGDEVLTPDSSRFCMEERYSDDMAAGRKPSTSDKQYVRDEGAQIETPFVWEDGEKQGQPIVGIDNLDPEDEAHVDFVSDLEWPQDVPANTTGIYTAIFERLSGVPLATFQANVMKIAA
ncbi:MAG: phosphoribosylaminoimidazolesuccinocarboxamide synthase, partial [Candidatus Buchananbacteria bacterium]